MSDSQQDGQASKINVFQCMDANGNDVSVQLGPLGCAAGQLLGQREEQQDCYGWMTEGDNEDGNVELLLVLADGMGGHRGGAVASRIAIEAFGEAFGSFESATSDRLEDGLENANEAIDQAARKDWKLHDMGTTLIGAHLAPGNRLRWISVGDSPMWRLTNGSLTRLNKDHSMKPVLAQLVERGYLTAEDAATDRRQHELRSVVMGEEIPHIDLQDEAVELGAGDVLIIASDGLETLSDAEIAQIADSNRGSATTMVKALLNAVARKEKPRQDNATVIVYLPDIAEQTEKSPTEEGLQQAK